MPRHDMFLDTTSKCMRYRHQQRLARHPMMPTTHNNHLNWIYNPSPSVMISWTYDSTTMHMFTYTIHHVISIHIIYMQSSTNSTYMYSPTIEQSINIHVFTDNCTINQHICIHQHQLHYIVQKQHTVSHIPSKGENTSY